MTIEGVKSDMDFSELEGYPYVAVDIFASACSPNPVWCAGNTFIKLNDGRTFIQKGKLGKRGGFLKKGYEEFFVVATTLYELHFDGSKYFYREVPDFIPRGDFREKVYY